MLPRRARMDLGVMAMKGYSAFPKAPNITGTSPIRLFSVLSRTLIGGVSYPSAEVQSVYSTAPADGAIKKWKLTIGGHTKKSDINN